MKIWIDITNTPHVNTLMPIIRHLEKEGHELIYTARDFSETLPLLAKHGITCEGKRAVQVTKDDYAAYDYLLCMDGNNIRNLSRIIGGDPEGKVRRFMEPTARGGDVADPWYTDRFDVTYRDIEEGCEAWLDRLIPQVLGKEGKK